MANLYKLVKQQGKKIKSLENRVAHLESELELVRALVLAQKKDETVPFRKLGPYYDEPNKKFDDRDWWKNQPWMVKPCDNAKNCLGVHGTLIGFDEYAHEHPELDCYKTGLDAKGNLTIIKVQ